MKYLFLFLAAFGFFSAVQAQGLIITPDHRPAGLDLRGHHVTADIQEQVAVVTVTHTFYNAGKNPVEGIFLFPLPKEAQVSRFKMEADGKTLAGELLDAEDARRIYEDIVRRSLDPALLEMVDHRTFRARVFPIPPGASRTLTLRYDATLPREGNTVTFRYPRRHTLHARTATPPTDPARHLGRKPAGPERENTLTLRLETATGLKNIYSPSHTVQVDRQNAQRARVSLDDAALQDGRDFILYYSLDTSDLGATLLAHRPYRDRDGYFMLLLEPPFDLKDSAVQPRDIVFVLDTSGSMAGDKIDQAKDALHYALNRLGNRDRFGLIAFNTDVDPFRRTLASADDCDEAGYFIDRLEARGGTNINDALLAALNLLGDNRQGMIVFLTDGLPSSGITDEAEIRTNVEAANGRGIRLFTFGVGYDVNTRLLDGLSRASGAFADYISPDENIEERVSTFYEKVRYPVLTDLSFELTGVDGYAFSPGTLPDLYKGAPLLLTGRYRTPGKATLTLRGSRDGKVERRRYIFELPKTERERDFVARLWATRRVGHLLDEIRLHGENDELKQEVVALAKEFGLVTPYTAYLVQEEERAAGPPSPSTHPSLLQRLTAPFRGERKAEATADAAAAPANTAMSQTSGRGAVQMSKAIREMQEAETAPGAVNEAVRAIQGRLLAQDADGAWVDLAFDDEKDTPVRLKFASEAYFTLLRRYPEARAFTTIGDQVTFYFQGTYLQVGPEGRDAMSEAAWEAVFK